MLFSIVPVVNVGADLNPADIDYSWELDTFSAQVGRVWDDTEFLMNETGSFEDVFNYSHGYAISEDEWIEEESVFTYNVNYSYFSNLSLTGDFNVEVNFDVYKVDITYGPSVKFIWIGFKNGTYYGEYNVNDMSHDFRYENSFYKETETTYKKYNIATTELLETWSETVEDSGEWISEDTPASEFTIHSTMEMDFSMPLILTFQVYETQNGEKVAWADMISDYYVFDDLDKNGVYSVGETGREQNTFYMGTSDEYCGTFMPLAMNQTAHIEYWSPETTSDDTYHFKFPGDTDVSQFGDSVQFTPPQLNGNEVIWDIKYPEFPIYAVIGNEPAYYNTPFGMNYADTSSGNFSYGYNYEITNETAGLDLTTRLPRINDADFFNTVQDLSLAFPHYTYFLSSADIMESEVEGTMEQKSIFSQLLFGSNNYLNNRFITGRYGSHEQPKTSTLSRMRFMITKWNIELFNSIGLEATEFEIEGAKRVALEVFEDWIFSNPQHTFIDRLGDTKQWTPFIKEAFSKRGVQYTKDDLRPDFELSDTIITAVSHRLYRSIDTSRDSVVDFSLEKIRTGLEMGSKKFYRSLKNGKFFSQKTLERMYKKIAEWHVQELGDRESGLHYDRNDPNAQAKLYYYQKALKQIVSYANLRGITLFDGSSGIIQINSKQYQSNDILRNEYDRKYFIQQNYKQFHMLFQLAKYLGFDPLTFTSLDDKDMASQGGYALHHFLAEMMRQMSSNVADIVCTSSDLHNTYEKYKLTREGEAFIRGLMKTIQDLIFLKDSSGSYISRIKPAHVLNKLIDNLGVEKGNEAYQRWTSSPNKFMENLDKFNDRRPFALSKDPNKYRIFLENVFTETWKNRNQDAIKYYHFIRKSWASNVAILFSYNADIDIMNSVYRIGIPLA